MKVLIFCEALGGGVLSVIVDQVNYLKSISNVDFDILYCRRPETPNNIHEYFPGCKLIEVPFSRGDSFFLFRLFKYLRGYEVDGYTAIHLHSSFAGFVGRLSFFKNRSIILYTPHCYAFLFKNKNFFQRLLYFFIELFCSKIGMTVACGMTELNISKKIGAKSVVARNAIRNPCCHSVDEKKYDLVSVGRIAPQKGFINFLAIVDTFARKDKVSIWVGSGDDYLYEQKNSKALVTGWLPKDELYKVLATSRVYVSTAEWEGLPVAPIEAQYMGLPVVALDRPGLKDVVINGFNGYLCMNVVELECRINQLLSDESELSRMSRNARAFAEESFTLSNYDILLDLYK
ncbi:glycosyltransferase [Chitinibacter sp. GC72]|uniref:glycosyltransferase n=1 Tax=Chitinibacter sp. GC72 TaxID=1526917 RepID=UPI0012FBCA26|nr:glycosyltransferase [Chitinibacter sp. GC72]